MTDAPRFEAMGLVAEARFLRAALAARRARSRGDAARCRDAVLRGLSQACPTVDVASCAPILHSRGGLFSAAVSAEGEDLFVKAVLARSRETAFWERWATGAVHAEGRRYRLLPPRTLRAGWLLALLTFPFAHALDPERGSRHAAYRRQRRQVLCAVAEFNARHLATAPPPPGAGAPRPGRAPSPRRIAQALALGPDEAAAAAERLRRIEAGWDAVRRRLARLPHCLSHLDPGPGNVVPTADRVLLLDFGHAAAAPVGSDLHSLLRYAPGRGGVARDAATYTEVFRREGQRVDAEDVRIAAVAHFAQRYRDLQVARHGGVRAFRRALAASETLIAELAPATPRPKPGQKVNQVANFTP